MSGQAEWDAKSVASTDMLRGKSEVSTAFNTPGLDDTDSLYKQYPFPPPGSRPNLPYDNPSTDQLLPTRSRAEDYSIPRRPSQHLPAFHNADGDHIVTSPLLDHSQSADQDAYMVPYPPSAYNQPPPHGYTPPGMRRQQTDYSDNSDIGAYRQGPSPGAQVSYGGYDDPYESYEPRRQGSRDELGGQARRQGSRDDLEAYGRR